MVTFSFLIHKLQKEDKDWLYPQQMIQAIKKVQDSIILLFSPTKLCSSEL
jgi:hypothetical protein